MASLSNTLELSANYVLPGHGHRKPMVSIVETDLSKDARDGSQSRIVATLDFSVDHPETRKRVWAKITEIASQTGAMIDPKTEKTYGPKPAEKTPSGPVIEGL